MKYINELSPSVKTTTVIKMNDSNKKLTAHLGTFACPNAGMTASQTKEPEFCQRQKTAELKLNWD